jgi:hypothetical protein
MRSTVNRIVWQNDPYAFLSGLCWLATHGVADEALSVAAKTLKAHTGSKLALRCGPLVEWISYVTGGGGLVTRRVHLITCEDPAGKAWGGIDEGHVGLEAWIDNSWRFFDPTNNAYLAYGGAHFPAGLLPGAVADDTFQIERIAADATAASEPFAVGQFDVGAWAELELTREGTDGTRRWIRRIYQAVGIAQGSQVLWKLPPGREHRTAWVESRDSQWVVIDPAAWDATFY